MATLSIKLDSGKLIKHLAAKNPKINKIVVRRLDLHSIKIRNHAIQTLKENRNNDTGQLRSSIKIENIGKKNILEREIFTAAPQGQWIEFGRKASGKPAPAAPLVRWAARKLGRPELGYAIAQSKATKDTKPQPFLHPAFEREEKPFFDGTTNDIAKAWRDI